MIELREMARDATNILIPKGDDNKPCVDAFQEWADIEVPIFRDRELMAKSCGRAFWLLKGKDIPGLVVRRKDTVGTTGTDSRIEYNFGRYKNAEQARFERIGDEMCRFSLLSLVDEEQEIRNRLDTTRSLQTLPTVTSRQKLLGYYSGNLPIVRMDIDVNGSVEGVMKFVGAPLAADIVQSGDTAEQNGLVEVFALGRMYP